VRDKVRECLEKDPSDRTEEDIEILLEFTQQLKAFTNITLSTRRALCSVMVCDLLLHSFLFFRRLINRFLFLVGLRYSRESRYGGNE